MPDTIGIAITFPDEKNFDGKKTTLTFNNTGVTANCTLIKLGTFHACSGVTWDGTNDMLLQLNNLTVLPDETETASDGTSSESKYTVSTSPLICVNCNFCLDENSANIFLTRVDFSKETPKDHTKLFGQYISLPIKTNYSKFDDLDGEIFGVSTDKGTSALNKCTIVSRGDNKFIDCNIAENKDFENKGGKDDDHATVFKIYFNVTQENLTLPTKYEIHLVKGDFLSFSFTLLFLFLGILF